MEQLFNSRPGTYDELGPRRSRLVPVADTYDVNVVGLGYVGLPTAALLAERGHFVAGCDICPATVVAINLGRTGVVEPGLGELVDAAVGEGRLRAFGHPTPARVHLICVPTPANPDGTMNSAAIDAAVDAVLDVAQPGNLIVLESTVAPGTTREHVGHRALERGFVPGKDIYIAHAPERVLPGSALREVVENPRIVGGLTEACTRVATAFYRSFVQGQIHSTVAEVAETAKLAENAFRDVNIGYANELANICQALQIDVREVIHLANHHPRVSILSPGPGVGGHCIAIDPKFLASAAPHDSPILRAARAVNEGRPARVVAEVRTLARKFRDPKIACLGLSYKADIEDLRESPALDVVRMLHEEDVGTLLVSEPHLTSSPVPGVALVEAELAVSMADIVVILVPHQSFRRLPAKLFSRPCCVDTVGMLSRLP